MSTGDYATAYGAARAVAYVMLDAIERDERFTPERVLQFREVLVDAEKAVTP